jgi:hypothetical protein
MLPRSAARPQRIWDNGRKRKRKAREGTRYYNKVDLAQDGVIEPSQVPAEPQHCREDLLSHAK